jgi:poly(A) polymerase
MSVSLGHLFDDLPYARLLKDVGRVARTLSIDVYAVGGVVRDVLLNRPTTDIDFVTVGPDSGIRLARAVADDIGGVTANVYPNFGTAGIRARGLVLEFVAARKESYARDSRKPEVESGTLEDDLFRRDFTVNALAVHLWPDRYGELVDPHGGVSDLGKGVLRTPLDPVTTFDDDPLRIVRAARFAAQLAFEIDADTFAGMADRAARIDIVSPERITTELQKIVACRTPSVGFRLLYECGVLARVFPELTELQGVETVDGVRHKDNFFHTLQVLDNLVDAVADRPAEDTEWLRWAALLHDIGKPATKRFTPGAGWSFHSHEERGARMVPGVFRRLRLPTDERMKYVQKLVRLHHRPVSLVDEDVTDSAVRRLLFDAGDEIDDLMTLVRADITSKNPKRVRRYLRAFDSVEEKFREVEEKDHLRNFQPPIDGLEIMETLDLKPGRAVGDIKNAIREAILEGDIPNEYEAARAYMMQIKDDLLS